MADEKLIRLDDAISAVNDNIWWNESEKAAIRLLLRNVPTVEAEEVVHGQWETTEVTEPGEAVEKYSHFHRECKYFYTDNGLGGHYRCPNCGAKMDKDNLPSGDE